MRRFSKLALLVGTMAIIGAFAKVHATTIGYDFTASFRFAWTIVFAAVMVLAAYMVGLPDLPRRRVSILLSATAAAAGGTLTFAVVQLVVGQPLLPRFVLLSSAFTLVPFFGLTAMLAGDGRTWDEMRDRVLVVAGPGSDAEQLAIEVERAERPAQIVGFLSLEAAVSPRPLDRPLVAVVDRHQASVLVLDRQAQLQPPIIEQAALLHERGVRIRTLSLFYEEWLGKLPVSELERVSLMFDIGEVHRLRYGRAKRLLDVGGALVGFVGLVLLTPVVLAGNLLANRGSLFYAQRRVGRAGREFNMYKFRTMRADAAAPTHWTGERDPRITRFGGVLRKTHLDELPQVWNILRGDLSLVGPRPEQPHYVEELTSKLPFYSLRHLVRPGLTGWAQVKYGYAASESDAVEKLQYEFYYLRHQKLILDLRIVARTLRHVMRGGGR